MVMGHATAVAQPVKSPNNEQRGRGRSRGHKHGLQQAVQEQTNALQEPFNAQSIRYSCAAL